MSLVKTEVLEKNVSKITFSIDHDTFEKAIDAVYHKQVRKISIPGFRPGKAPRAIIEKMYGKGVFYEDAINDLIPKVYPDVEKESGLDIVSQPEFDIDTIDENGCVLTAKVYTKPEVSIKDYKGIEATKDVVPVTDADIDAELARTQERNARMLEVTDRAAEKDDIANIDYKGSVDGVAFDGGTAEKYDLTLGSGSFIPGFEDQIIGHKVGDSFDVNVTFPADYHAENLKGKAAVFACKLNALKKKELPLLDDDFARDVSEFDTLDAYKADIRKKLEERNEKTADAAVDEQLTAALIEKVEADIPEAMFVQETENFVRDYDSRLRMQGLDLNTYFKYTGMTLDTLRQQMRPDAERQVKSRLALEKIAELEKVTVSDEEIEEEYKRIAEAYGMEIAKVKELVEVKGVSDDLKVKKAVDIVKAAAVIKAGAKKAPAKKAASKKTEEAAPAEKKPAAKKAPAKKAEEAAPAEKKPAAKKATAKKAEAPAEEKAPAKKKAASTKAKETK